MAANYQFIGDATGFNLVQLEDSTFVSAKRISKGEVILQVDAVQTKLIPTAEDNAEFVIQNSLISVPSFTDFEDLYLQLSAIVY